jgi:hypothetical protein
MVICALVNAKLVVVSELVKQISAKASPKTSSFSVSHLLSFNLRPHVPNSVLSQGFDSTQCRYMGKSDIDLSIIDEVEMSHESNRGRGLVFLLLLDAAGLFSDGEPMTMSSFLAVYSVVVIEVQLSLP